jgi:hypothetical protein
MDAALSRHLFTLGWIVEGVCHAGLFSSNSFSYREWVSAGYDFVFSGDIWQCVRPFHLSLLGELILAFSE